MNRACCFLALAVCTLAGAGCVQFQEYANENIIAARNKKMAEEAWRSVESAYPIEQPYRRHFKAGFIAGYYDVASGGDGCPPILPPKKYWAACYQSPAGHEKIRLWFNGFSEGVMVAKLDGVNQWTEIPISVGNECEYPEEPGEEVPPAGQAPAPPPAPPAPPAATPTPLEPVPPPKLPQSNRTKASDDNVISRLRKTPQKESAQASPIVLPVAQ